MRKSQSVATLVLGGLLGLGLAACEKQGPAERAGERIDEAAKDVKEGAEKAGDRIEEAGENLNDRVEGRK